MTRSSRITVSDGWRRAIQLASCAMLLGCSPGNGVTPMSGETEQPGRFDAALAQCRDCPVEIILWSRGGPPGPAYTSDQLTVSRRDGLVTGTYVTARFDRGYEKNFRALRYRETVRGEAIDAMLAAIRAEKVFDKRFPSEENANLADGLKDSYTVTIDGQRFEKTLIQSKNEELDQVKQARNRLVAILLGARDVSDLNRRLAN